MELLAIIVMLAIILTISIPSVRLLISNTRIRTHLNNEDKLVEAARLYLTLNSNMIPQNIGDTVEVKLSDLQAAKHIGIIKSPMDKDKECNGYVLITKIADKKYGYTPHLNCVNSNIGSSVEDGLIGHYNFDDFQEPTVNLAQYQFAYYSPYHTLEQNNTSLTFKMIGSNRYLVIGNVDLGSLYGRTFSYSGYMEKNGSPYIPSSSSFSTYNTINDISNYKINPTTGYFEGTMYFSHETTTWILHWPVVHNDGDVITINKFQIEEKLYPTPYTPAIRGGIVWDYSGNKNNAELQLVTTPRWTGEGINATGAYEFNGISNLISTKSFTIGSNLTVCFWAKPYISAIKGMAIHGSVGSGAFELFQSNKLLALRGGGTSPFVSSSKEMVINEWTFACASINGNIGKVYYNGVLSNSGTVVTPVISSNSLNIGAYSDLRYGFNGVIDEVRIYNRVLSEDEIKYNYEIQKYSNK